MKSQVNKGFLDSRWDMVNFHEPRESDIHASELSFGRTRDAPSQGEFSSMFTRPCTQSALPNGALHHSPVPRKREAVCKDAHSPQLPLVVVEEDFEEVSVLVLWHILRVRDPKRSVRKVVR